MTPGQFVQGEGGVRLGAHHPPHPVGGECRDDPVVQHPRGVHDAGQRVGCRYRVEQGREGGPVRDITGVNGHPGARLAQLRDEFPRPRRVRPAPAGEQQMPDAVRGDQVPRHQHAQGTGAAGDQDGALRVERPPLP